MLVINTIESLPHIEVFTENQKPTLKIDCLNNTHTKRLSNTNIFVFDTPSIVTTNRQFPPTNGFVCDFYFALA